MTSPHRTTAPSGAWVKAPAQLLFSLPSELLATYLRLKFHDRGHGCWASLETLSAGLVSERQLRRHLRELERRALIVIEGRSASGTLHIRVQEPADACAAYPSDTDTDDRPERPWASGQSGHERPVKQIPPGGTRSLKYNKQTQPVPVSQSEGKVVVSSSSSLTNLKTEASGGLSLPLHLPDDLAALPTKRKGLSAATLRRLVGLHGEARVREAAAVLVSEYPDDAQVRKGFGALLSRAVADGWRSPEAEAAAVRQAREAALAAAAPPVGTCFARAADGALLTVLEVTSDFVRTETGVIPRALWSSWAWLTGPAPAPEPAGAVSSAPLTSEQAERRSRLALVAAALRVRRQAPEQADALLARHGVSLADVRHYMQEETRNGVR